MKNNVVCDILRHRCSLYFDRAKQGKLVDRIISNELNFTWLKRGMLEVEW